MSTHFLVNMFTDQINSVVTPPPCPPTSQVVGSYVVRVPDEVPVRNPTGLPDLITKKYAGILGTHGLFTQIVYDDMLDALGVDNTGPSTGVTLGDKGVVGLYPTNAAPQIPVLQTTPMGIVWGGPPPGPSQALVTYELFEYVDTDNKGLVYARQYREVTPDIDVSCQVSFNNGATFISTTDKALVTIPLAGRGTQIVLKFTRLTSIATRGRVLLGSWAVLF
jgi:hypothetical protein